jgi:hypothetical protein
MDERTDPTEAEVERIAALPASERAAALEALETRLRASLDEIASA